MKASLKTLFISYIAIIVAILAGLLIFGDNYSMYVMRDMPGTDAVSVKIVPEGVVEVSEIKMLGNKARVSFEAIKPGTAEAQVTYTPEEDKPFNYTMYSAEFYVTKQNIILNGNFDFGGNRIILLGITLIFLVTLIHFFMWYQERKRKDFFAYRTILDLGLTMYFAILTAIFCGVLVVSFLKPEYFTAVMFFDYAGNALSFVVIATIPLILIFAVFMGLSNIRLIQREGFRPVNLLGIFIGVFMIAGALLCFYLLYYAPFLVSTNAVDVAAYVLKTAMAAAFMYFECILLASVICIQKAGKFNPTYNKDFLIILGCGIKKDGTLFPLIRGRVDRAIRFYKEQLEATGKEAIFVPSGGKGSDEIISEGEAMKRYLLEQGIPEEKIMAETNSTTTLENMKFSKELIDRVKPDANVAFSTTRYHVFRGGMFAREVGMHASGMGSKTKWYFWPNAEVREFVGLVVNELWTHVGVVLGLAAISLLMANLGNIMKLLF